jgi:hypothetical protein
MGEFSLQIDEFSGRKVIRLAVLLLSHSSSVTDPVITLSRSSALAHAIAVYES